MNFIILFLSLFIYSQTSEWKQTSKRYTYKDPGYAAKISFNLLPIAEGQFYVEDVNRGIWYTVAQTCSLLALVGPYINAQVRLSQNKEPLMYTEGIVLAAGGGISYLGLKVISAFQAAKGAEEYNKKYESQIKQSFNIYFYPTKIFFVKKF